MKKLLLTFLTLIFFTSSALSVQAATPTPATKTASPSAGKEGLNDKLNQQINQLKEKIASRVSELNLVERRGLIGTVTEISANKITVKDPAGKTRFVDTDEITKFASVSAKGTFGLSDLTKGTKISVLGLYNKQSKRLLARFISTTVDPIFLSGTIADIDKKNFFVTIATPDQKQTKIDILTSTKILGYDKTSTLTKVGFSTLQAGDRITVIGYPDKKDPSLLVATRLVNLAVLPRNPKIVVPEPTASESAKVTPIR